MQTEKTEECWGWIPILTQKLFFDVLMTDFKKTKEVSELTEEESNKITKHILKHRENFLSQNKKYYSQIVGGAYKAANKVKVIFSVDSNNKIDHALFFINNSEPAISASCTIEDRGLVSINLLKPGATSYRIGKMVFTRIRDVYHAHTHHHTGDLLLEPVIAKDKNDAIEKIFGKFELKIFSYLKKIKEFIDREINLSRRVLSRLGIFYKPSSNYATELLAKAKGEMLYALNFTNLFKTTKDSLNLRVFTFSNAYNSIDVLSRRIEAERNSFFNTTMVWLTIGIFALTVLIAQLTYRAFIIQQNIIKIQNFSSKNLKTILTNPTK